MCTSDAQNLGLVTIFKHRFIFFCFWAPELAEVVVVVVVVVVAVVELAQETDLRSQLAEEVDLRSQASRLQGLGARPGAPEPRKKRKKR